MRCCCGRTINPKHAYIGANSSAFGPVCAVRLGLVKPARKRKPGKFAIFRQSHAVKIDDGQVDFFGVMT